MSTHHGGWPGNQGDGSRPSPAYEFPTPPRRASATRTAVLAGLGGAVVVVVAAAVLLMAMLGDDGDAVGKGAPPARSGAPTTAGGARPPAGPAALALPPSLGGASRVPAARAPDSVRDIDAVSSLDFDAVTTVIYRSADDARTTLFSTGVRRDVEPTDFVRDFVPKTDAATEAEIPANLWTHPGLLRCWDGAQSVVCLWGDDTRMLFGSAATTVDGLVRQMEGIYRGDREGG